MKTRAWLALAALATALTAAADDREAYNRRAAERDLAMFRALDLNGDGLLSPDEVRGAVDFAPRFNDIDVNRDGVITPAEMQRYLERTYGVKAAA